MPVTLTRCRSCGEEIVWAMTTAGRAVPINNRPKLGGNIELTYTAGAPPVAHVVKPVPGKVRFVSHFATCPDASMWKRR
jgi:hypothetical protein